MAVLWLFDDQNRKLNIYEWMVSVETARQWQQSLKRFRFQGLNKILNMYYVNHRCPVQLIKLKINYVNWKQNKKVQLINYVNWKMNKKIIAQLVKL